MTPEERQLLAGLFDRTRAASSQPRDREAEAFIADAVQAQPYAPYLLAQTVIVQEHALQAANERLQQLEAQVRDLQQQAPAPQSTSFLGGLFGGGDRPATAIPPTSVPTASVPPTNASPWGRTTNPQQQAPAPGGWPQPARGKRWRASPTSASSIAICISAE